MNDKQTTRRRFLVAALTLGSAATGLPGVYFLRSSAAWAQAPDSDESNAFLATLAQRLFPHDGLADDVYAAVMGGVLDQAANDPGLAGLLASAEGELNAVRDSDWFELDDAAQIAALKELEGKPFFAGVRETVRFHLYYHPQLWAHIGYPGSSKEHGGYLHRGFNDIAWLPEEN